jgi:hypothetical protein
LHLIIIVGIVTRARLPRAVGNSALEKSSVGGVKVLAKPKKSIDTPIMAPPHKPIISITEELGCLMMLPVD